MRIKPVNPLFIRGPSVNTRLVWLVLVSVLLMTLDHSQNHLRSVRTGLSVVIYPLQLAVSLPFRMGNWGSEALATRSVLMAENAKLRERHLRVQARLGKYEELVAENRRLRSLLGSPIKAGEQVMIAELLSVDLDPFSRQIVLNKGSVDAVEIGQPLVDAQGVMGQVIHVNPFSSTALLITDPSHALPVQMNRTGLRAVAVGTGLATELELIHLPNNVDVAIGDLVVTSGLGGRFPAGYPVGRVHSVAADSRRPFASVKVTPSAQLERNREVLLMWLESRKEQVEQGPPEEPEPAQDKETKSGL